jgi:hypothetical protein
LKTLIKKINSPPREGPPKTEVNQSRRLVFVKTVQKEVWTCAACAWTFVPSGPPLGDNLEEMMQNFEKQRDMEFAFHVCARHPKRSAVPEHSSYSYQKTMEATTRTMAQAMNAKG